MVQFFVLIFRNFRCLLVIIYTAYSKSKRLYIFTKPYVSLFGTFLKINSHYFQKDHQYVGLFVRSYIYLTVES